MSMTKAGATVFEEAPDADNARLHEECRQQDILEIAQAIVSARKALDLLCLRGAELADGSVRRAFIDCGVLIQAGIQRVDREFNLIERET